MKLFLPLLIPLIILPITSCQKKGCTNEKSGNYDTKATTDDGSCSYAGGLYAYATNTFISIRFGVADTWGPIGQCDIEIIYNGQTIHSYTRNSGGFTYDFIESQYFLDANVLNGNSFQITARSSSMSGSATFYMNTDGNIEGNFIMIN
ncbi:MAG: hypothetical protein KDC84_15940 [Crocinitomicaceae bacterium]|nr:hypothetical protein [Crocinitomicaceae bacterium]